MLEILYEEGKERFGLEKEEKREAEKNVGGPSRKTRSEKKKKSLKTVWLQAN